MYHGFVFGVKDCGQASVNCERVWSRVVKKSVRPSAVWELLECSAVTDSEDEVETGERPNTSVLQQ